MNSEDMFVLCNSGMQLLGRRLGAFGGGGLRTAAKVVGEVRLGDVIAGSNGCVDEGGHWMGATSKPTRRREKGGERRTDGEGLRGGKLYTSASSQQPSATPREPGTVLPYPWSERRPKSLAPLSPKEKSSSRQRRIMDRMHMEGFS